MRRSFMGMDLSPLAAMVTAQLDAESRGQAIDHPSPDPGHPVLSATRQRPDLHQNAKELLQRLTAQLEEIAALSEDGDRQAMEALLRDTAALIARLVTIGGGNIGWSHAPLSTIAAHAQRLGIPWNGRPNWRND